MVKVCDICKGPYLTQASLYNADKDDADWTADLCEKHSEALKTMFEAVINKLYAYKPPTEEKP